MPDIAARLLKLAEAEFKDLTEPEREVIRCAAIGEEANLTKDKSTIVDHVPKTGGDMTRASVFEWLCTNASAQRLVHKNGIIISNATFDTTINFAFSITKHCVKIQRCEIPAGINAVHFHAEQTIIILNCKIESIINLQLARIDGQLQFRNTTINGHENIAINADGIEVKHGFVLYMCTLNGEVRFRRSLINGDVEFEGSVFLNKQGYAIDCECSALSCNLFMRNITSEGELRIQSCKIDGNAEFNGSECICSNKKTINLDGTNILGSVYLNNNFRLTGAISIIRATINGSSHPNTAI